MSWFNYSSVLSGIPSTDVIMNKHAVHYSRDPEHKTKWDKGPQALK